MPTEFDGWQRFILTTLFFLARPVHALPKRKHFYSILPLYLNDNQKATNID